MLLTSLLPSMQCEPSDLKKKKLNVEIYEQVVKPKRQMTVHAKRVTAEGTRTGRCVGPVQALCVASEKSRALCL